jgi:hypothetical protein
MSFIWLDRCDTLSISLPHALLQHCAQYRRHYGAVCVAEHVVPAPHFHAHSFLCFQCDVHPAYQPSAAGTRVLFLSIFTDPRSPPYVLRFTPFRLLIDARRVRALTQLSREVAIQVAL